MAPGLVYRCIAAAFLGSFLLAQTAAPPAAFEVVSIKRADPKEVGGWVLFRPGGRLEVRNSMVAFIVQQAYGVRDFQVVDGPKWISDWNYRFHIDAKASTQLPNDQMRLLTQAVLAERFQLKVHREMRDLPVFLLTAAKSGLKIKTAQDGSAPKGRGMENVSPGLIQGQATIADLIGAIGRDFGRPIVDKTGFNGMFDFRLDWAPMHAGSDDMRPALPMALQEQLGLKLDAQKAPVEVLVIDRVETPSGN